MANFFDGLWGIAKHPFDEAEFMVKGARDVVKGDRSVGDLFGDHQEMMSENITVPLGGRNKLTENSDAVAGAIVGGILAAPAIGGAFGGGGGGASGSGFGGFGTEGAFSNYFKPSNISNPGLSADGVGWKPGANKLEGSNFIPTDYEGAKAAGMGKEGFDIEALAKTLQSIKPHNEEVPISMTRTGGGGGRYDKSVFENQLLTRELNSLYNQPLYNKLT